MKLQKPQELHHKIVQKQLILNYAENLGLHREIGLHKILDLIDLIEFPSFLYVIYIYIYIYIYITYIYIYIYITYRYIYIYVYIYKKRQKITDNLRLT